jgi:hypothetical protein
VIRRLLSLSFLFFALATNAQQSVSISPLASFDFGSPLFINRAAGVLNPFGIAPNGSSSNESYGIGAHVAIPDFVGRIGLVGQLEGVYNTGEFTFASQAYTVSGIDRKLLLEIGALWDVQSFAIRAGPWVSQSISRNVYENAPNGIQIASGDSIASNKTHFGVSAGIALHIADFPFQPEINTHLDLTELSEAGVNAWSVGISLTYNFEKNQVSIQPESERLETRSTPVVPAIIPRVRFLVNGSEANANPPIERIETRVKQYAMVDSPNVPPRVTQWVEESYHLPHLALSCEFDRHSAGYLMILKDSLRLMEKYFEGSSNADASSDTILDLEKDVAWNAVLSHLNTGESNRLIAELRTNREQLFSYNDTLVLPPADTSRSVLATVKKQTRFVLSDNFSAIEGGQESLDLLLGKMRELLDSNTSVTILQSQKNQSPVTHTELLDKLEDTLGKAWSGAHVENSPEAETTTVVLLEN